MNNEVKFKFWKNMWPYIKEYKNKLIFCIICSMLVGICVAVQPLVIKYIVDNGISNQSLAADEKITFVASMCMLYIFISVCRVVLWRLGFSKMFRSLEGSLFNLRSRFFSHVQQMDMKFYEKNPSGVLFNCIMGTPMANIKNYMNQIFIGVPYQLISLCISLFALMFYDWVLTFILLTIAVVMAIFNKLARRKIKRISSEYIKSEAEVSKYLSDTLNGMDAIKLYSIEDSTYNKFSNVLTNMYEKGVVASTSHQNESVKPEMIQYIGTAIIYFVGAVSCVYRNVSVGTLYAFLSSMTSILAILITWLNINLIKSSAESGLKHIVDILNTQTATPEKIERQQYSIEIEKNAATRNQKPCVEFRDIDFAYDNRKIFSGFSAQIKYGESVALVGGSGSGKSTFSKLLMRLYDVQQGEVLIHGKNIKDYSLHDLRVSFGIVPQDTFIFYGSIWDNIKIARPNASNKDIIQAMETAHVHEFVNNLEKGWNTIVGDGGLDLSGGQKQRIAIARAILGNPDILIFDEATSALDNISEKAIQDAMEALMKTHTVIIIAHRLSTIRNVDRIMVFDSGKIIEEGTYDQLSQKEDGTFAKLLKHSK